MRLALLVGATSIAKVQNFIIFIAGETVMTSEEWEGMQPAVQNSVYSLRSTSHAMQTELNKSLTRLRDIVHAAEQRGSERKFSA